MRLLTTGFAHTDYHRTTACPSEIMAFTDLEAALAILPWHQRDGQPMAKDEDGQDYETLTVGMLARPADVAQIERQVCQSFYHSLLERIDRTQLAALPLSEHDKGLLRWRIRPEFSCEPYSSVVEYREDGPDLDHHTDRRCVMDHDWRLIRIYARFTFAPLRKAN